MRYSLLIIIILVFSCQPKHDVPITLEINQNWEFKSVKDSVWQSATVPGNVFSDLLDNDLIEDPFIGDNEHKVQWVSENDWEYRTHFNLDEATLERKHFELNFEGLDTYTSVYLNDSLILNSDNAFIDYSINVKPLLKAENELRLVFEQTSKYEDIEKAKLPYELPEGNRVFIRKAQFQYGWDWGPVLNTSGIWRPVKLVSWNDFKIEDVYVKQFELSDSNANLMAQLDYKSFLDNEDATLEVFVNDSLVSQKILEASNYDPIVTFQIENPKLWWPHNLGEPYLYDLKFVVKDGQKVLDSISVKKGLRTIELVAEKDSIGQSFYFKVNDVPVYAKGANYIPQHSFQNEVSASDYQKLLSAVVTSNMNMLRVWGGGIYEDDIFYDLCDEKGILVWQDFMFACAMYPGDQGFMNIVEHEAYANVRRLRNHASIALWCGNNENSEGWHRWGWQAGRSEAEKEEIWKNYLKVFDSLLPKIVDDLTDTDYWESSPKYGRGNPKYKTEGDAHDWWIWHDAYPFEHLEENVPRFMSEFGFQSFPSYEVIRFINQNDSLEMTSEGFKNHQKHARGFQLIDEYMKRDFPVPATAEDYIYMSQLLQAHGIVKGIEAHRRAKPYNMGTLYWQLNDCWPAVSWSSMDHFGNWKALQYKAKQAFENVLISSKIENDTLQTWIVNDGLNTIEDNLSLSIKNFDGTILWQDTISISVEENSSEIKFEIPISDIQFPRSSIYFDVSFNGKKSQNFFVKPKDLDLKQAPIQTEIEKTDEGFKIVLVSKTYQKDVFLSTNYHGQFEENFFDLQPGERKTVIFKSDDQQLEKVNSISDLKIKSLNQFIR
ncbi:beta-mannosidase [Winogradskyella tangerina]|uniref:beta-mannosidase n=1 Tax=Winogradskyella tangerina TaxID=2023240 RepID=UPI000DBE0430|nr:glycoside hydrolase family 2 protein [Winogradskyella tangerina]